MAMKQKELANILCTQESTLSRLLGSKGGVRPGQAKTFEAISGIQMIYWMTGDGVALRKMIEEKYGAINTKLGRPPVEKEDPAVGEE